MGILDRLRHNYDLQKLEKYTKRRMSQTHFESRDRDYYEAIYRNGEYLRPNDERVSLPDPSSSHLAYQGKRWSPLSLLKKNKRHSSLAATKLKTSETYTHGQA